MLRLVVLLVVSFLAFTAKADVLQVKKNSPTNYVVVKGDTLWDISAKFLKSPWRWPEIWGYNSQIADPHWIYPGDLISLIYVDGKPRLTINRRKQQLKMSPHGRIENKLQPIPTLPLSEISNYLTHQQIVTNDQLGELALVIGSERDTLFYKLNDIIYVNRELPVGGQYGIYRHDRSFRSPKNNDFLGHELELTGVARVVKSAKVSRLELLSINSEIKSGQIVMMLADNDTLPAFFTPQAAPSEIMSTIVATGNHYQNVGKNNVVVIDGGSDQGIAAGQVFSIYRAGSVQVIDENNHVRSPQTMRAYDKLKSYFVSRHELELPDVYRGKLMVFRSFNKVSYALITELDRPVHIGHELINP